MSKRSRSNPDKDLVKIPTKKAKALEEQHKLALLRNYATKLRIHSVESTSAAGSGHPTTCASLAELFAVLFFDPAGMRYSPQDPENIYNDKLVLSKGHAAPILYAAWAEAGLFPVEKLLELRTLTSDLEGHPTPRLPFVDVATGSLGQGISVACGMAYSVKHLEQGEARVYVVLGDGECAEGSVWEAFNFAAHYQLDNLVAIVDVNRLGQSDPTMLEHNIAVYKQRLASFGWQVLAIDGHSVEHVIYALNEARNTTGKPTAILARTFKGKGFTDVIEDQLNWHGKPLGTHSEAVLKHLKGMLQEDLGSFEPNAPSETARKAEKVTVALPEPTYTQGAQVSTRAAYGEALKALGDVHKHVIALDGDTKNSTMAITFQQAHPDRFVECFIAEQNMVGVALGASCRGYVPFVSAFAAFFSRAYDHVRMCGLSWGNVKFVGTHCGVSIGEDGGSQMGLEDLAAFRAIPGCIVLYPSDAVSTHAAVQIAANHEGPAYLRISRPNMAVVHPNNQAFASGKAVVLKQSSDDVLCLVGAGVTTHEALKAWQLLQDEGIAVSVVDLFSVKPVDKELLTNTPSKLLLTVEDHYPEGGIHEAVAAALSDTDVKVHSLAVNEVPRSGKPDELLDKFGISAASIVAKVKSITSQ